MKKVRIFVASAALLLITAGVFAGKSKLGGGPATDIYYLYGTTYELAAGGITSTVLQYTTGTESNQAKFNPNTSSITNTDYLLFYTPDGSHYYPVYY